MTVDYQPASCKVMPRHNLGAVKTRPGHGLGRATQIKHDATLASTDRARYIFPVTANSVTGFSSPIIPRRISAPTTTAGAFFVPVVCYGGCAWEAEKPAGFLGYRSANLRTAATLNRLAAVRGSSIIQGARP